MGRGKRGREEGEGRGTLPRNQSALRGTAMEVTEDDSESRDETFILSLIGGIIY